MYPVLQRIYTIRLPIIDSTIGEIDVPPNISEKHKQLFASSVKVSLEEALKIECSTQKQSEDSSWFKHRQCRLTASNFGKVLQRKKEDCSKLVNNLTACDTRNINVCSLRYGRENEDRVAQYYAQYQEKYGHPGIQIFPVGLVVNPKYSWLGASPDRLVYDPTCNPPYGCLEVKCIESGKGMTPLQTFEAKREPTAGKKKVSV